MAKIYDVNTDIHESPNRNTFDLLHKRHMTGKAGVITPFLCMPVVPTDSFEIDTAIGANLMPMWYPTQSNMRFIVHYFFIPNRLMHDGWKNQIEGLEEEDFPYLDVSQDYYKTCSLADYLGVPTNFVVPESHIFAYYSYSGSPRDAQFFNIGYTVLADYRPLDGGGYFFPDHVTDGYLIIARENQNEGFDEDSISRGSSTIMISHRKLSPIDIDKTFVFAPFTATRANAMYRLCVIEGKDLLDGKHIKVTASQASQALEPGLGYINIPSDNIVVVGQYNSGDYSENNVNFRFKLPVNVDRFNSAVSRFDVPLLLLESFDVDHLDISGQNWRFSDIATITTTPSALPYRMTYYSPAGTNLDISEFIDYCPYFNSIDNYGTDTIKLSAFPFRAYEMTYNAYYRNWQGNQPFVVGGVTQYNEYLPTHEGGSDRNRYELHTRNWELDSYTSCLPSPQQGDAPIISVDSLGRMRIQDEDGTTSTLELRDLNGEQGVEVKNVDIANPEHARLAMRVASSGLTIADFRQGNALQRFLEQSLRSGYRYADFIFGHFGKAPSHQELDMPVFIGGYTQNIDVSKISNVSASGDAPLGEFAGVGASFGGSKHKVKHYFDDFGWLLGVMMLVPDAAYSQVLPKPFTYNSRLDWYFPEFSQLGLQPITYEELCPIQSHADYVNGDTSKLMTDTFGYQRPNHEHVWLPDTLHGLFRNELAGSVINRRFGTRPVLGDSFLRIAPEDVNDIFSVTEKNDDIYIAQVVCDIKATRPIPRIVVPSLGR